MTVLEKSPKAGEKIGRRQFETILRTALLMEEYRFARQAALAWLANFPGDLPINLLYAQSLIKAGLPDQATAILEKIFSHSFTCEVLLFVLETDFFVFG